MSNLHLRAPLAAMAVLVLAAPATGRGLSRSRIDLRAASSASWHYPDDGSWAADFPRCGGNRQSPIDVGAASIRPSRRQPIEFHYARTEFEAFNNGHTIELEDAAEHNSIVLNGVEYDLLQFHFHGGGEHAIPDMTARDSTSTRGEMVAHFVHVSQDDVIAVVAMLLRLGDANRDLARIFGRPKLQHEDRPTMITINPEILLPRDRSYYAINGSLTTPPCSQGVRWAVLQNMGEVSQLEIDTYRQIFPLSVRNLQALNGRRVLAVQ